jgi:putative FmdB family regulatory protein
MPIYEYQCGRCDHVFEELVLRVADEAELVCPACKEPQPQRILSASAISSRGGDRASAGCVPRRGFA